MGARLLVGLFALLFASTVLGLGESSPWCAGSSCNRLLECRAPINLAAGTYELNNSPEIIGNLAASCGVESVSFQSLRAADDTGRALPSNSSLAGRFFFQSVGAPSFVYFAPASLALAEPPALNIPFDVDLSSQRGQAQITWDISGANYMLRMPQKDGAITSATFSFTEWINDYNTIAHEVLDNSGRWLPLG